MIIPYIRTIETERKRAIGAAVRLADETRLIDRLTFARLAYRPIIGAVVGGFLFDLFGATGVTGLNIYSMIVAIVGSVVVLWIYNAVTGRRRA
jgi:hypothetical protein